MQEALEESGLERVVPTSGKIFDVDIHKIPERDQEPEHYHYDVRYAFKVVGSEEYVVSEESHNLGWIEIEKLSELTEEESMLRMARKWKAVRGHLSEQFRESVLNMKGKGVISWPVLRE